MTKIIIEQHPLPVGWKYYSLGNKIDWLLLNRHGEDATFNDMENEVHNMDKTVEQINKLVSEGRFYQNFELN